MQMSEDEKLPKIPTEVEEESALNPRIHAELAVRYYMHSAIYNPNLKYFYLDLLERIAEADDKIDPEEFEAEFRERLRAMNIDLSTEQGRSRAANLRLGMILHRYYEAQPITIRPRISRGTKGEETST